MSTTPHTSLLELGDPSLDWRAFQQFCLELAHQLPGVREARAHGVSGDPQGGIDIHVELVDGRVRAIQCRHVQRFDKTSANKLVNNATYPADEYWLWCSCELTVGARQVLEESRRWTAAWGLDRISVAVRDLDRERARWLVEDYLGAAARKRFLGPEADLAVMPADRWFARQDARHLGALSTDQTLQGRADTVQQVLAAVDAPDQRVVVLVGRGGIGKTRLLRAIADVRPDDRLLWLRDGVDVTATLAEELPDGPFVLIVDDAHRRADLPSILATAFSRNTAPTVVLSSRPQRLAGLRADLLDAGIDGSVTTEVPALTALDREGARALAAECLDGDHQEAARPLAELTRDVPALCVLGARLINDGDLAVAELAQHERARNDILARFRDELIGSISDRSDPALIRRLMDMLAAFQPLSLASLSVRDWLADQVAADPIDVADAITALDDAGLLAGVRRRRIAPDIVGDHLLHHACVASDGHPNGRADELIAAAPPTLLCNVLGNLAELDWRMGAGDGPSVLRAAKRSLTRQLRDAAAWDREQMLKQLEAAASYQAGWIVELVRELLDHPAETQGIGLDHLIADDSARHALAPLLRAAAYDLAHTEAALLLLWEVARDLSSRSALFGVPPLTVLKSFGDYQAHPAYTEIYVRCALTLMGDVGADDHRELPVGLLEPLTAREGTTTAWRRHAVSMGAFTVNAAAAEPVRRQVREALADASVNGGPRTRVAAARMLGDALRQPFGYYGRSATPETVAQWRPEQLELLAIIDRVLGSTPDPLVRRRLRDALVWHADHSAIRGVRTRARSIRRVHRIDTDELLLRAISHGLEGADHRALVRRMRAALDTVLAESPEPRALLDRVDALLERLATAEPERHDDADSFLGVLAQCQPDRALVAAAIIAAEPDRPSAHAVGAILAATREQRADETRALVLSLGSSSDERLRRLAADSISRGAWIDDAGAPERRVVLDLASDADVAVVHDVALTAHRLADHDPDLARAIVLAIPSLQDRRVAKTVCMVVTHGIALAHDDEDAILRRLVATPEIEHWHDRFVLAVFRRRPLRALDYLLARLEVRDGWSYDALPFGGLSSDPLADHDHLRAAALDHLMTATGQHDDVPINGVAQLFWDLTGPGDAGHDLIAQAVLHGPAARRDVALDVLGKTKPYHVLNRPAWVVQVLDACPGAALDALRSALHSGAESSSRSGRAGEPFPEDLALLERATEHALASRRGSRAEHFWKDVMRTAQSRIDDARLRDQDEDEE
jgi:hypothetical protein